MNPALLAAALLPMLGLTGCIDFVDDGRDFQPIELTALTVKQMQRSGPPPAVYQGSIEFPYCTDHDNDFYFYMNMGYEVYQRRGLPGNEDLHLVKESAQRVAVPERTYRGGGMGYQYHVLVNETSMYGFNYTVHLWHEVDVDPPVHRWDFWYNLTFVPYQEHVYHEQGDVGYHGYPCWL